jgi:choline dehydrogenase-like flavoprotein
MNKIEKVNVCVIGSGAGGGVVAKELGEKGLSVVVLEAGKRFVPVRDYTSALVDHERAGAENEHSLFRAPSMDMVTVGNYGISPPTVAYGVGGTTLRYLAYMLRLHPDDFRVRTLDGVGADWPMNYEDLAPYYRKVELEMKVAGKNGDPWHPAVEPYPFPAFENSYANKIIQRGCDELGIRTWPVPIARLTRPDKGRPACIQCGDCGNGCLSRAKGSIDVTYIPKAEATGKVEVRPECAAAYITLDAGGRAKGVVYFDKKGNQFEQRADAIVLSAGTIQSPRILLNSKSKLFPDGLANSSGTVGKYFQQHFGLSAVALFNERIDSFRGFYGGAISHDFSGTKPGRPFVRGWGIELHSGYRGPAGMAISTPGWGARHKDFMRQFFGHSAGLVAGGEQLPDARNRIELDPEVKDAYGMPVPRVFYRLFENDILMLESMEKCVRDILEAAQAVKILKMRTAPGEGVHNTGTCRMGRDRRASVLNSFCQTHDVKNLFVADGSAFVTGGNANPALTIMALASRAADYIYQEGQKGNL